MPIPKKYQLRIKEEEPYGWLSPGLRESLDLVINGGQLPQVTISPTKGEIKASKQRAAEAKQRAAEKEAFMGNTKKPNLVQSAVKAIKNLPRNRDEIFENTMANLGVLSPANWIATGASALDAGLGLIPGYQRDYDRIYLPTDKDNPRLSGISRVGGLFKGNPTVDEIAGLAVDFTTPGVLEGMMSTTPRIARGLNALERGISKIGRRTTKSPLQEFTTISSEAPPDFTYSYSSLPEDFNRNHSSSASLPKDAPKMSISSKPAEGTNYSKLLPDGSTLTDYLNMRDSNGNSLLPKTQRLLNRLQARQKKSRWWRIQTNDIGDIKVYSYYDPSTKTVASYDTNKNIVKINTAHVKNVDDDLVHEIEHAIQMRVENFDWLENGNLGVPGMSTEKAQEFQDRFRSGERFWNRFEHATGLYVHPDNPTFSTLEPLANTAYLKSTYNWDMDNLPSTAEFMYRVATDPEAADIKVLLGMRNLITDYDAFVKYLLNTSTMLAPGALILPQLIDRNDSPKTTKNN